MVLTMINFLVFLNNILTMLLTKLPRTKKSIKKNFLPNCDKFKNKNSPKKAPVKVLINNKHRIYKLTKL